MSTRVIYQEEIQVVTAGEPSFWQAYVLKRFHPRSIFIDAVGGIWFTYFFWHHDWVSAVITLVATRAVCLLMAMNYDARALAETALGKLALLHLNPLNIAIQTLGVIVFLVGIWQHTTEMYLAGFSLLLLGHLFGWEKVDRRFGLKN